MYTQSRAAARGDTWSDTQRFTPAQSITSAPLPKSSAWPLIQSAQSWGNRLTSTMSQPGSMSVVSSSWMASAALARSITCGSMS